MAGEQPIWRLCSAGRRGNEKIDSNNPGTTFVRKSDRKKTQPNTSLGATCEKHHVSITCLRSDHMWGHMNICLYSSTLKWCRFWDPNGSQGIAYYTLSITWVLMSWQGRSQGISSYDTDLVNLEYSGTSKTPFSIIFPGLLTHVWTE